MKRKASHTRHVVPGEVITTDSGFLRGHGTLECTVTEEESKLIATLSGDVKRVNKLISVVPLRSRYRGDVGDVVIGRIVEVGQNRWKVDVNGPQDAVLMLSAAENRFVVQAQGLPPHPPFAPLPLPIPSPTPSPHLSTPSFFQRRKTSTDELQMRSFFAENDLISAEVQQFYSDGAMALHTRSLKYGKLAGGQYVQVLPSLLKRCKTTFHELPCGVNVILGNNGYIWIYPPEATAETAEVVREKICRVRNSLVALNRMFTAIHPPTIMAVYERSLSLAPKDMLLPENLPLIVPSSSK